MKTHQAYENPKDLLIDAGVDQSAPIDIEKIVKHLNLVIRYDIGMPDDILSSLTIENERYFIGINSKVLQSESASRFAIAHEIGHYCLHCQNCDKAFTDSKENFDEIKNFWNTIEYPVILFSYGLLMPVSLVTREGQRIIDDFKADDLNNPKISIRDFVSSMSKLFVVPNDKMRIRLTKLGIIKK